MLIGAGALIFGVAIAKSGVLSKWVGVDKKMLDHFKIIIISSDNNNVTPNVVVDYEPTQRLGADIINEIKGNERFSDVTLISFMIFLGGAIVFHIVIKIV